MIDFVEVPVVDGGNLKVRVPVPKPLRVVEGVIPSPKHGMFQIINHADGDKRIVWDSSSLAEIAAAKKMFDDLKKEHLTPFKVGINGKATSDEMLEFDPMEEQVMFLPLQLAGGG